MPASQRNLHGQKPVKSSHALLLIDVINAMDFPGGEKLLKYALPAARKLAALKARATQRKVPVIYVNDNFGRWQSDFRKLVKRCLENDVPGREIAKLLQPGKEDYFVLKPMHSGFYATSLELLLRHLQVKTLIIGGFAGNLCVLYTANDAYMRDFEIKVPKDGVASESKKDNERAIDQMKIHLNADVRLSSRITFSDA